MSRAVGVLQALCCSRELAVESVFRLGRVMFSKKMTRLLRLTLIAGSCAGQWRHYKLTIHLDQLGSTGPKQVPRGI